MDKSISGAFPRCQLGYKYCSLPLHYLSDFSVASIILFSNFENAKFTANDVLRKTYKRWSVTVIFIVQLSLGIRVYPIRIGKD